jgi:DNA-binding response OmpR family regulator
MAFRDLTVRSRTKISRRHAAVEPNTVPVSWTSVDGDVQPALNASQIRRFLTRINDSDSYQAALVTSTQGGLAGRQSSAVATQVLLLPLTWKDIFALTEAGPPCNDSVAEAEGVHFGEVFVDLYRIRVTRRGEHVDLTAMEFKVLRFLVTNPDRAVSRDELLNEVWGYHNYPSTRTIDNHILRLRQKLESDPASPIHFRTVHGVGYRFVPGRPGRSKQ